MTARIIPKLLPNSTPIRSRTRWDGVGDATCVDTQGSKPTIVYAPARVRKSEVTAIVARPEHHLGGRVQPSVGGPPHSVKRFSIAVTIWVCYGGNGSVAWGRIRFPDGSYPRMWVAKLESGPNGPCLRRLRHRAPGAGRLRGRSPAPQTSPYAGCPNADCSARRTWSAVRIPRSTPSRSTAMTAPSLANESDESASVNGRLSSIDQLSSC